MAPEMTHSPTPQTLDLAGLPEPVVRQLLEIVREARQRQTDTRRSPNQDDPEKWSAELRAWAESQPKRDITMDDSRESIYD